jgi:drug/metabolite transporter (DMT)-like permease
MASIPPWHQSPFPNLPLNDRLAIEDYGNHSMLGIGETAALTAAFLWSISSMLWRKVELSAGAMNLGKNAFGLLLMLIHIGVVSALTQRAAFVASPVSIGLLALSGLIGVAIGDTLYLRSLQILGPRISLMIATTSPVFSVVLGIVFLGEQLLFIVLVGIFLTVAGLVVVLTDQAAAKEAPNVFPGKLAMGIWCGIAGAVCQSVGGVLSRAGSQDCSGLEAAVYRVTIGMIVVMIYFIAKRNFWTTVSQIFQSRAIKLLIPATVIGTWMGIWLCQVAYKHADVAIAQTLLSTCPLFAVPILWVYDRQRLSVRGLLGTVIAVGGVVLVIRFSF